MSFSSNRPTLLLSASLVVAIPALLYSNPQQKAVAKPNPLEARIAALETNAKRADAQIEALVKLTQDQAKALEEADLRLTRSGNQLQELATGTSVKRLRDELTALKTEVDSLRSQGDEFTRIRTTTSGLADDIRRVNDLTEELRRKVADNDPNDLKRKIEEVRDQTRKLQDRQNELDRIGDKHEQRLNKLESKG